MEEQDLVYTYPPAPRTERGFATSMAVHHGKKLLAYCAQNLIVIRHIDNLEECYYFKGHVCDTTAVQFNSKGNLICSGDQEGNCIIWECYGTLPTRKKFDKCCAGQVKSIAWTSDEKRVIMVGQGKQQMGRVFLVDAGTNGGEISGTAKTLNSVDARPTKPYKLSCCGEDQTVGFYDGPSFKLKHSTKQHTQFVNCNKFSPDGKYLISVSSDKSIVMYDGEKGEKIKDLPNAHEMGIIQCDWFPNSQQFITASNDQSIKLWNQEDFQQIAQYKIKDTKDSQEMQVSVQCYSDNEIFSFSLSGALNHFKFDQANPSEYKLTQYIGHQNKVCKLLFSQKKLIAADLDGRIIIWEGQKPILPAGKQGACAVIKLSAISDNIIAILDGSNLLRFLNTETNSIDSEIKLENATALDVVGIPSEKAYFILYDNNQLIKYKDNQEVQKIQLDFKATVFDLSEKNIAVGDQKGILRILDMNGEEESQIQQFQNKIVQIKFSPCGKRCVSGESGHKLQFYDLENKKHLTSMWSLHASSITSLDFSKSGKYMASASLDSKVIIWDAIEYNKVCEFKEAHRRGVLSAIFDENDNTVSGGGDSLIKILKSQKYISEIEK